MREKTIIGIFENLKSHLMDLYTGPKDLAELIIDIRFERCRLADRDHYRDRRVYMHVGCEDMRICVSSSIEVLDRENIQGLFLHEIGHIIKTQIPDMLEEVLEGSELTFLENMDDDEVVSDYVIEQLFGIHIFYDEKKVQWVKEV